MTKQMTPAIEHKGNFQSQFGTIMSIAGLAIGMGNCRRNTKEN